MKLILALSAVAAAGLAAHGQVFSESEPNDTIGTADFGGVFDAPGGSILFDGQITENDVDWFSFTLSDTAGLAVFAVFSGTASADAVMQIVDSDGFVIAFADDSLDLLPSLQLMDLAAGTYFVGVSGFGDANAGSVGTTNVFDGLTATGAGHGENFVYKLSIGASVVPTPASLAMLGLGGVAAIRRRR